MNKAKIIQKGTTHITFEMESTEEITPAIAVEQQSELGYHPAGYNFLNFKSEKLPAGVYFASWQCYSSAD